MTERLDIETCIGEARDFFLLNPWLAIGGLLLYLALVLAGNYLPPILSLLSGFLFVPAVMGGGTKLAINLAANNSPRIEDLTDGFTLYGRVLAVYWLSTLIFLVLMIPMFFLDLVSINPDGSLSMSVAAMFLLFVNGVLASIVMLRWSLVYFVMMDEESIDVVEIFRRSSQLTKGNRDRLFLMLFMAMILIGALLTLLLVALTFGGWVSFVGAGVVAVISLYSVPILWLSFARAYLWLKSFHPPYQPQMAPPAPEATNPE